jgi:hypothetical protein
MRSLSYLKARLPFLGQVMAYLYALCCEMEILSPPPELRPFRRYYEYHVRICGHQFLRGGLSLTDAAEVIVVAAHRCGQGR